jgi:hypothetical protein
VIVIAVVNGELMKIFPGELALTSPADPRVHLERLFTVILLALLAATPSFGNDPF